MLFTVLEQSITVLENKQNTQPLNTLLHTQSVRKSEQVRTRKKPTKKKKKREVEQGGGKSVEKLTI